MKAYQQPELTVIDLIAEDILTMSASSDGNVKDRYSFDEVVDL